MVSIDIERINKTSNEISTHIESYEETLMNLFNKLKDATNDWHDPVSLAFDEAMIIENTDSQNFLSELKLRKNIFSYTNELYSNIGKKINCDFNNKENLINKINNCISECTSIINEFNRIDNSFYYSEYYLILNQKTKIVDVRTKLRNLKEKLNGKFQKISEYEDDIAAKINELESFKINEFEFVYDVAGLKKTKENYIYEDLLTTDIKNIELYKLEETKDLKSIFSGFNKISEGYTSSNVSLFKKDCEDLKKNIEILAENREKYITELENQTINYSATAKITKEKFENKED